MIDAVLNYLNRHFPISLETGLMSIVTDGIEYLFAENYLVGQYINIYGSILNDGTYKIISVAPGKLTLDAVMLPESNDIELYGLAIPKAVLDTVAEIEAYTAKAPTYNIESESQGKRSIKFKNGSSWDAAFASKLAPYRAMFDDRRTFYRDYNITSKGW